MSPSYAKILLQRARQGGYSSSWDTLDSVIIVVYRKTALGAGETHTGYPSQLPSIPPSIPSDLLLRAIVKLGILPDLVLLL